jgi:hypothetical protein
VGPAAVRSPSPPAARPSPGVLPPRLVMVVWAPQQLKKVGLQGKRQVRHIVGRQLRHPDHRGRYLWGVVALPGAEMAPSSSQPMPDRPGVANAHCSAWSRALISGGARMRSTPPWWGSWQVGQNSPAGPQQGAAEGAGSGAWRADAGVQANRPSCEPAKLGKDSGDVQRWWPRGTAHALCPLPQTCMIRSHDREDGSATGRHSGAVPFPNASTRRALG